MEFNHRTDPFYKQIGAGVSSNASEYKRRGRAGSSPGAVGGGSPGESAADQVEYYMEEVEFMMSNIDENESILGSARGDND